MKDLFNSQNNGKRLVFMNISLIILTWVLTIFIVWNNFLQLPSFLTSRFQLNFIYTALMYSCIPIITTFLLQVYHFTKVCFKVRKFKQYEFFQQYIKLFFSLHKKLIYIWAIYWGGFSMYIFGHLSTIRDLNQFWTNTCIFAITMYVIVFAGRKFLLIK